MVANSKPRRATYADIESAPEHMVAEILNGELVLSPRPAPRHQSVASVLGGVINGHFHGPSDPPEGGWWILDEPEIRLSGDAYVPDVAGWRRERMPTLPNTAAIEIVPDWVCEVLSPSTQRSDRVIKMQVYAQAGVAWVWLVHPISRTVEVFRLDEGRWAMVDVWDEHHPDAEAARIPPFDALPIKLARWWA